MADYRRIKAKGGIYFFTLVLNNRKYTQLLIEEFELLKSSILKVKSKYPFKILALVVLPDHLHMIMQLPNKDDDYSLRIRLIKTYFSKKLNAYGSISDSMKAKNEKGIWQRRFWEHIISDEDDLHRHIDYIHYNPVKHGYCKNAGKWPYSTFHNYAKRGVYPYSWGMSEVYEGLEVGE